MIDFVLKIPLGVPITGCSDLFVVRPVLAQHIDEPGYEFMAWGDPIAEPAFARDLEGSVSPLTVIRNLEGHYYYILLDRRNGELFAGNSLFSVLPVYYNISNNIITLSNSAVTLGSHHGLATISKRFILEVMLFNYPLFNDSILENIKLLPANSFIRCNGPSADIVKHTQISDWFCSRPVSWKRSVNEVTDIFISAVRKYLPDKPYANALTGGFDGRTLMSAGLFYEKPLSAYSFGSAVSKDKLIASVVASAAGVPFFDLKLEEEYVNEDSLACGKEFILGSSGTATFSRAHYLYAARKLSGQFEHIITGNFGSEVFRALHVTGAVMSGYAVEMFGSESPEATFSNIESGIEFKTLVRDTFRHEWASLREEIFTLPSFSPEYSGLTGNQRFYLFVFEEMFRKYFGAEMVNQFRYLKNRTPFIDSSFLKAIFGSELAGIHSEYYVHNPVKRYKGQILYSHIIRKTSPGLGKIPTDRGYRPDDLISPFGKLNIVRGYLNKILRPPPEEFDPYGVRSAWSNNRNDWLKVPVIGDLFDMGILNETVNREVLYRIISLSYAVHELTGHTRAK